MSVWELEPVTGVGELGIGRSWRVRYRSTAARDGPVTLTGLVHLPAGRPPGDGWPVTTYGHMTTGGSDAAAPSLAAHDNPERRRLTQGDDFVRRVVRAGVAVLRPDYEGLGSPGPHPYLLGAPLGASVVDLLAAAWESPLPLARRWVSAGHSEGAVAAAFAAAAAPGPGDLRGVALFAPVTGVETTIGAALRVPVAVPGTGVVPPLTALMISGAALADDRVAELVATDGLSPRARGRWPQLEELTLTELAARDSWGGIAPARILGPRGPELRERLLRILRDNDIARLAWPEHVPIRIDAAAFDEVAPWWLTVRLARSLRARGGDVQLSWWRCGHSPVLAPHRAPGPAAAWVCARLG